MNDLKELFLLAPDVVYLNHGSFGATPRPVFEVYRVWQEQLEQQPVQFLITELPEYLAQARAALGELVNADADDLVFVPNATFALNIIARSLDLGPGDEVLTTNHEYGACNNVWEFVGGKRGFRTTQQVIPLPYVSQEAILEQFWSGVSEDTRVIFISHITSVTAVHFPVAQICARAREAGILTIVDGAHTLGQIEIDLQAIGADFYFSNAHKWLCSPKGSAFLYTSRDCQHFVEPLVVGWGWGSERSFTFGSDYLDYLQYLGTDDFSAYLTVPAAIQFQVEHHWTAVRDQCHDLLCDAIDRICALTGLSTVYPGEECFRQMAIAPLPLINDLPALKSDLYDVYHVEVPLIEWHGRHFIRVSVQGYNSQGDIDALLTALQALLPQHSA